LGWPLSGSSVPEEVSFFRTAGGLLSLWGTDALATDAAMPPAAPGFRGVALAINLDSADDVDAAIAEATAAGATTVRPGRKTTWGGYVGYFADPDGHLWEVTHNPFWSMGPDSLPILP
jgi:uncharacterized glyoxalase superfamily protein PhnB